MDELRLNLDELLTRRENLKDREEQYHAVFEHTGTATFIFDYQGIVQMVNDRGCDLIG